MDDIVMNGDYVGEGSLDLHEHYTPEHAQQWVDKIIQTGYRTKPVYRTHYVREHFPKRVSPLDALSRLQTRAPGRIR